MLAENIESAREEPLRVLFPNQRYSIGVLEDPERLDPGFGTVKAGAAFPTRFPL